MDFPSTIYRISIQAILKFSDRNNVQGEGASVGATGAIIAREGGFRELTDWKVSYSKGEIESRVKGLSKI